MTAKDIEIKQINNFLWEIPKTGQMRVAGRIYASTKLIKHIKVDESPKQVANVATLPGIIGYSLAMPDIHWGYGFPIGGVAALDYDNGVISPGGVGYDINCGCRLASTNLSLDEIKFKIKELLIDLFNTIPCGVGSSGAIKKLSHQEEKKILAKGALWTIEQGFGNESDLEHIENGGCLKEADPNKVSHRALERGANQMGTLGSGNHFLEIGVVDKVFLPNVAEAFGLREGTVTLLIHTGSRGLGHQICDDYLKVMMQAVNKYKLNLPDRQLACAPLQSPEGKSYLAAMCCAANYAWANRQSIMHLAHKSIQKTLRISPRELGLQLIYDVCHNIAKIEDHQWEGKKVKVCVHRKGATRAFPPFHPETPLVYKKVGQPVLIPGDMGTCSFVCVGSEGAMTQSFGSTCHGAGRLMSRKKAIRIAKGRAIEKELKDKGILVLAKGRSTLAEEMPDAYKNVEDVVEVMDRAGISPRVARLRPIGVIKG